MADSGGNTNSCSLVFISYNQNPKKTIDYKVVTVKSQSILNDLLDALCGERQWDTAIFGFGRNMTKATRDNRALVGAVKGS